MFVELFAKTDVGRVRRANEDNLLVLDLATGQSSTATDDAPPEHLRRFDVGASGAVLVVSDGMGGALAGDVASRMAIDEVRRWMTGGSDDTEEDAAGGTSSTGTASVGEADGESPLALLTEDLRTATEYANYAIHHRSLEDAQCAGMGATFTGAAVVNRSLGLVQVGDSRAYLIRAGKIRLVTKDQSLVQQLIDAGTLTEEAAETHMFRNVILQALGAQGQVNPATDFLELKRDDVLLLCSDGLSGKLRADDMLAIVNAAAGDLAAACDELVREANARGGEDNITVVLARFSGDDLPPPDADDSRTPASYDDDTTLSGTQE